MVKMISGQNPRMPMSGGPLTAAEVKLIQLWISQGASDDADAGNAKDLTWWSLKPLSNPAVPTASSSWARSSLDAFILAELKERDWLDRPKLTGGH